MPYVVIVDDETSIADLVARALAGFGWTARACNDGAAALRLIKKRQPDLVISDLQMPGLDGLALLRVIRSDKSMRVIPVIIMSGSPMKKEALVAGANGFLSKPFSLLALEAEARRLCPAVRA